MGVLAIVFDERAKSASAAQALRALHAAGSVTLFGMVIVVREVGGRGLSVQEPMAKGASAAAPAVGAVAGALVSLLGGPAAAAARTLDASLMGTVHDLLEVGLAAGFIEQLSRHLRPGCAAILADVEEESPLPLEACIAPLGGRTLRQVQDAIAPEELMVREAVALRREVAALRQEPKDADHAAASEALRRARAAELRHALRRARILASALRREAAAKVVVLREQAASLEGETRAAIEHRAGLVRKRLALRASQLDRLIEDLVWPAMRSPASGRRGRKWNRNF
ncbi:MAG TPA: hypothetical protein VNR89_19770 [Roseomonas sp.]|nr:hypothetical protein [Roseomonas sp.]